MRPSVRPGAMLLRRDATHLQVGTNPGIIVRDQPGLYPLLLSLDGVRDLASLRRHARRFIPELTRDVAHVLAPLVNAGVVVDVTAPHPPQLRVTVAHDAHGTPFADSVAALLDRVGLAAGAEPDLTIIISLGEPDRRSLVDAVRCRVNHLPVVLDAEGVHIGPVVVPGQTPCVGCTDLPHRTSSSHSRWRPRRSWPCVSPSQRATAATKSGPSVRIGGPG